jgi:hypothetical protein
MIAAKRPTVGPKYAELPLNKGCQAESKKSESPHLAYNRRNQKITIGETLQDCIFSADVVTENTAELGR